MDLSEIKISVNKTEGKKLLHQLNEFMEIAEEAKWHYRRNKYSEVVKNSKKLIKQIIQEL